MNGSTPRRGSFSTNSHRGRATEGPFAGDGRKSSLKSGLVRGFTATDEEIDAVVAFLTALTDEGFLASPALGPPSARRGAAAGSIAFLRSRVARTRLGKRPDETYI